MKCITRREPWSQRRRSVVGVFSRPRSLWCQSGGWQQSGSILHSSRPSPTRFADSPGDGEGSLPTFRRSAENGHLCTEADDKLRRGRDMTVAYQSHTRLARGLRRLCQSGADRPLSSCLCRMPTESWQARQSARPKKTRHEPIPRHCIIFGFQNQM